MLELKDGGRYINRLGKVVTVEYRGSGLKYPFTDANRFYTYDEHGFVYGKSDPDKNDLVAVVEKYALSDTISKAVLVEYINERINERISLLSSVAVYKDVASEITTLQNLAEHFNIQLLDPPQ